VAWRRSAALLQAREEEEEDRGEKRREILIVSGFLSLVLLRKPNREAKAWRRWW
jgi:hypothetical protein